MDTTDLAARAAYWQARAEALEHALERRSEELRLIQGHVCISDLILISRACAGMPLARGAYDPAFWRETTDVTEADIEETLKDLWIAVTPSAPKR